MKIEKSEGLQIVEATVHVGLTISEAKVGEDGGGGGLDQLRARVGLGVNTQYHPHITLARRPLRGHELELAR